MSESDTTTSAPSALSAEPPTQEIFVSHRGGDSAGTGAVVGASTGGTGQPPWDDVDADDEWPVRGPRQGIRLSVPTVVLLVLLIAAGGIWGGAALQRSHGTTTATSSRASTFASLFGGRGATGATAAAGGLGGATTGTVTEVSGSTLYVTNASGALVKVTVGPTATVDRNAPSPLASLQVGDTVVVEGSKASDGSVTATSVSATAAGVPARSGFGGFGAVGAGG